MSNITSSVPPKQLPVLLEIFKRKPVRLIILTAAVIANIAIAIFCSFFIGPLASCLAVPLLGIYSLIIWWEKDKILFERFKISHSIDKISNSDMVLMIEAKEDSNKAFSGGGEYFFRDLVSKFKVAYKQISNVGEINRLIHKAIIERKNTIKAMFIRGHGNPQQIVFGKGTDPGGILTVNNVAQLISLRMLKDIPIILESCSTGKNVKHGLNIAGAISVIAKNCRVIAPTKETHALSLAYDKKDPLNTYKFCDAGKNITKTYKFNCLTHQVETIQ